jgi:hypothetical protein
MKDIFWLLALILFLTAAAALAQRPDSSQRQGPSKRP